MKQKLAALLLTIGILLGLAGCAAPGGAASGSAASGGPAATGPEGTDAGAPALQRPLLLNAAQTPSELSFTPSAAPFEIAPDLGNIINLGDFEYMLTDEARRMLLKNGFVVLQSDWGGRDEFYDLYEMNRYSLTPNFVTTDAMMHTYHLYFSRLLKGLERDHFSAALRELTGALLSESSAQYLALKGTEWENAALRNAAFFTVAGALLDPETPVADEVRDLVSQELALIEAAQGPAPSPVMNVGGGDDPLLEDYSQYIPRGYYTTSEELSRYFRAMMWYGRLNFRAADDDQSRSALLMAAALQNGAAREPWEKIYTITSFFVGSSDDAGFYEYAPLIEESYGGWPETAQLPTLEAEWEKYKAAIARLEMPAINSIPVPEGQTDAEREASVKGFRLMGQRFVLDAGIFQKLIYSEVTANSAGENRTLPSALDVPAALGSDAAREILAESGADDYAGYAENMQLLRDSIAAAPDTLWSASLYGGWLNTLRPLTQAKGEGWPQFMQNDAWAAKSLNTFLGSWAELKHDTVLYAKQVYAEMGGGGMEEKDDRGYVEPEPLLFARLSALASDTRDGLAAYGVLGEADADALSRMASLADSLASIAEKELTETPRTEEEYELIRSFGGQLEHFWYEAIQEEAAEAGMEYFTSQQFPSAIIADVATDPNGAVLEVGTGGVEELLVVVNIEGSLRIASGGVYSFYEFAQPISERLTDQQWRKMLGKDPWDENGNYVDARVDVPRPAWIARFAAAPQTY